MQAVARVKGLDERNRRGAPRRQLSLGALLSETGGDAVVHDLSATGVLIETRANLATFEQLQLDLPEVGMTIATVMWNSGSFYGCELHKPLPQAAISAALLRSPFTPLATRAEVTEAPGEEASEVEDDRLAFGVRLRIILGLSLALWALILWAAGVF